MQRGEGRCKILTLADRAERVQKTLTFADGRQEGGGRPK